MDLDDLQPRPDAPLTALEKEDLDTFSVDELKDRVARLTAEIDRVKALLESKDQSRAAADALFKKG